MPVNRSFERELAVLESMSGRVPDEDGVERLRKALAHENNYLVAKAARIVADYSVVSLLPEVRTAYDRFFLDAVNSDPQCWAKNALIKALVKLDCRDSGLFLRGLRHFQEEPVWGGQSDTAGSLRATCTHALAACEEISNDELLDLLIAPLLDIDKTVRMEAARAIGSVGGANSALLLKLRVLTRKEDAEVMGACFSSLLNMHGVSRPAMIALVTSFLDEAEESAPDAAFALSELHDPSALSSLMLKRRSCLDAWFLSVLDNAIAQTRLAEGIDFLLEVIENDTRHAPSALEAISRVHRSPEITARVRNAAVQSGNDRILQTFHQFFPDPTP